MVARCSAQVALLLALACSLGCSFVGLDGDNLTDASVDARDPDQPDAATAADRIDCSPLPAPGGTTVTVSDVTELETALAQISPNTTILFQPGTYGLSETIDVITDGVSFRSSTGDPASVTLTNDANGNGIPDFNRMFNIEASDVTVAEMTLMTAATPLSISGNAAGDTIGARFYRLVIIDFEDRGLEVTEISNTTSNNGLLACSRIEGEATANCNDFTAGVDIRAPADGWRISENTIGPLCTQVVSTTSQLGIRVSRGARFTVIDHNTILSARDGIRVGDLSPAFPACNGVDGDGWDTYQTMVCNNVLSYDEVAGDPDVGLDFFHACDTMVLNNTIGWDGGPAQSIVFGGNGSLVSHANNAVSSAIDVPIGSPPLAGPDLFDLQTTAFTAFPTDMSLANVIGAPSADLTSVANAERYCSWDRDGASRDLADPGFGAFAP